MDNTPKTGSKEYIEKVRNLDSFQKLTIYMDFKIAQLTLKHDFNFVDHTKKDALKGYPAPQRQFNGISFFWYWPHLEIMSFEDFISDKNIVNRFHGNDWKKKGFAKKNSVKLSGIYEWYWKLKDNKILDIKNA